MKIKYFAFITFFLTSSYLFAQQKAETEIANVKTDIQFLASDNLQGRLAGSPQDKIAADYIVEQYKKAGLTAYNGNFLESFKIVQLRIATSKSKFEFHFPSGDSTLVTKMVQFRDFFVMNESGMNDSAYALPVYLNYGIEAPNLGYNDYQNTSDLKGKIFIMMLGYPGEDTAVNSPFLYYAEIAAKIKTAIKYGASGIVFTPGSPKTEKPKGDLQRNATTYPLPIIYMDKVFYPRGNMLLKIKTNIGAPSTPAYNTLGFRNNHKKNTVIICAHHDHLGHNEFNNSLYGGKDLQIHNGADDNASGVATVLELARTLKGKKYKKNNYLFITFSGEELGLLGSKYFLSDKIIAKNKINYVVNIDMLGRIDSQSKTLIINGTGTSPIWNLSLSKIKNDSNELKIVTSASGLGPSDHASFYLDSIPVLHFFSGQHYDYHKPTDDENKINYYGMWQSIGIIRQIIAATNKAGKIPFTKTVDVQPGRKGFKVTMGIMPDYAFTGTGLKLDGVSDGKPAQLAGLQRGDIIHEIGSFNISNIQDYMKAMQTFQKGMKIKIKFTRGEENKEVEVTL